MGLQHNLTLMRKRHVRLALTLTVPIECLKTGFVEDQRGRVKRLELLTREDYRIKPLYLGLLDRTILHLVGDSGDCWSRLYK